MLKKHLLCLIALCGWALATQAQNTQFSFGYTNLAYGNRTMHGMTVNLMKPVPNSRSAVGVVYDFVANNNVRSGYNWNFKHRAENHFIGFGYEYALLKMPRFRWQIGFNAGLNYFLEVDKYDNSDVIYIDGQLFGGRRDVLSRTRAFSFQPKTEVQYFFNGHWGIGVDVRYRVAAHKSEYWSEALSGSQAAMALIYRF
jgi:hypothetical protein